MMKEHFILDRLQELGELSIVKSKEYSGYYEIKVGDLRPYLVSQFTEETLYNTLINLTAQTALKESWWSKNEVTQS